MQLFQFLMNITKYNLLAIGSVRRILVFYTFVIIFPLKCSFLKRTFPSRRNHNNLDTNINISKISEKNA